MEGIHRADVYVECVFTNLKTFVNSDVKYKPKLIMKKSGMPTPHPKNEHISQPIWFII
jgi:hypothetical protein